MNHETFKHPVILKALRYDLQAVYDLLEMYDRERDAKRLKQFHEMYGTPEFLKDEVSALEAAIAEVEKL